MFEDANDEFLKSFEASHEEFLNININNPGSNLYQKQKFQQCNNLINFSNKNIDNEQIIDEDIMNQEPTVFSDPKKRKLKIAKKFSLLSVCYMRNRKLSGEDIDLKLKQQQDNLQECAKSHKSVSCQEKEDFHFQKSNKSQKSKSLRHEVQESQSSFMKKIRNLQTRLKNVNLNYKTLTIKSKQENQKLIKQQTLIKNFLTQKYPNILAQFDKYVNDLKQQDQGSSFMDNSSNSSKQNDEWMPIMSKIQQLKIDGIKIFQKIKIYQQKLNKQEQIDRNFCNPAPQEMQGKRGGLLRKYSIPAGLIRQKKLSFQTTMITELKQPQTPIVREYQQNDKICKSCNQVKTFIYKFNQSLKQVPFNLQ